jgi:hypothetical protein
VTGKALPKVSPPPDPGWLAANVEPVLVEVPATDLLWRVYKTAGKYPQAWNSFRAVGPLPGRRFDHHLPPSTAAVPSRAILYAAGAPVTAVAEVFQEQRVIDRTSLAPELAAFMRTQRLKLLDVSPHSPWPLRAGAAAALQFGDTALCQRWSRAAHEAYPAVHGLAYLSTLTGRHAYALYERAQPLLSTHPIVRRRLAASALIDSLKTIAHEIGDWPIV